MRFVISAASLMALISAVVAQTAGFDAITTPAKDEIVPAGSSYVINWDYTSTYAGTVTIQLLQGATPSTLQLGAIIASGVDNSLASYTWPVDSALGADATYGIKITYDGDATGATFQYSNPFAIGAAAASTSASSTSAPVTSTSEAPVAGNNAEPTSTIYATQYHTVTSCAATVTDCPARSTVVSSSLVPVTATGAGSAPPAGSAPASSFSSSSPVVTGAPSYPAGNSTAPSYNGLGTVTISKSASTTGSGAASTTSAVVTAGAGRVAFGGVAVAAGLVAAVFAL